MGGCVACVNYIQAMEVRRHSFTHIMPLGIREEIKNKPSLKIHGAESNEPHLCIHILYIGKNAIHNS